MAGTLPDRERLVEGLVVRLGLVDRREMDRAVVEMEKAGAMATADSRPLAAVLVERGLMEADRLAAIESLAAELLERHGGDVRRCLEDASGLEQIRRELELDRRPAEMPGAEASGGFPRLEREDDADEEEARGEGEGDDGDALTPGLGGMAGGRFQVLHGHARGGIGVVSVAFDAELQREVAFKQIKAENADDPSSRARFLLEAEVTGRLEHPGIVPVYGLGFDRAGRPYYAMRFVRGITLDQAIEAYHRPGPDGSPAPAARQDMLELRALLGRFVSVCHTMAYAHSRNVLHRDLKPANILLGPYNETLVVDWGLAKVLGRPAAVPQTLSPSPPPTTPAPRDDERSPSTPASPPPAPSPSPSPPPLGSSSSTDTVAGAAFGTPSFMSPEQAEGQLEKLGPASDVYSLGAVLYAVLCGRPPFESAWCEVTSLLAKVKLGEFPAPRAARPAVPRPLEAVCLKAMARRPEDRYADAEALAADIERWMADEPVSAFREPPWAGLARWGRRHRPLIAGATALLTTAVVGLTIGLLLLGRAHRETASQRQAATIMSDEATERAAQLGRRDYINRVNLAHREILDDNAALGEAILYECSTRLRGWEWSHVQSLAHPELDSFYNDPGRPPQDVWCLAFSPDGRRLAAGSGPWFQAHTGPTAALTVRDLDSGRVIFARQGEPGALQAVAFSADGRRVVSAAGTGDSDVKGVLTCHDVATGATIWTAEERDVNVLGLAFSPDGRTLAAACGRFNNADAIGHVQLYDSSSGSPRGVIRGGPGGVLAVAYSPDGALLAMASRGVVDVWDVAKSAPAFQLGGHREFVYGVAFSPDGRLIASAGWDRTVRLWARDAGQPLRVLRGHRGFVRGVSFSPDGRRLATCGEDRSVRIWDVDEGRTLASFHGHQGFVHCVAFSPDGIRAASGSMDGTVRLWPAAAKEPQVTFRNGSGWVGSVAVHPGGGRVATAHNGEVRVWDPRTGEEIWRVLAPRGLLGRIALAFTPDGSMLAAAGPTGRIRLRDAATGRAVRSLADDGGPTVAATISPDGSTLAGAGGDGIVRVWDIRDGTLRSRLAGHTAAVNSVCFAPDGRRLASASDDRTVKVWDMETGKESASLSAHATGVRGVAFAPDGRTLASVGGQYSGTPTAEFFLWDLAAPAGRPPRKLEGHTGLVQAVAYSPDGRRIATASDDRTIQLWDAESGEGVFTLRGHTSGVVSLAISRDGRQIVSGGIDFTAKVWTSERPEVAPERVRRRAAVEIVESLFEAKLLKSEVVASLRSDPLLDEPLRAAALEVADARAEDALALHEAAWLTIVRPTSPAGRNALAVAYLEVAARLVEDDPGRLDEYRNALALAYYRAGRPADALVCLPGPARVGATPAVSSPLHLAVLAMASQKIGHPAEAHAALGQLRALVRTTPSPDPVAAGFLREAEEIVHE